MSNLLMAFYGDDFTGSTDAMEILERAGVRTVLLMRTPDSEGTSAHTRLESILQRFPGMGALGIAGTTRAMTPDRMEAALRPAFEFLRQSGAGHVHYKVCSTFDSSPAIGSIGKAIDIGSVVFNSRFVSLVVAAPALGRYCAFGNLFARMGIGSNGAIHRLDRHPSMRSHPTTPADEADLRLHLSKQTPKSTGVIDILQIEQPLETVAAALETAAQDHDIVLFDALYEHQMAKIGALIDPYGTPEAPHFSVGSSGVEMALTGHWKNQGMITARTTWPDPGEAAAMLVVSGSCSPVTARQIDFGLAHGFEEIALDTPAIAAGTQDPAFGAEVQKAIACMQRGKSLIIDTSKGTEDARFSASNAILKQQGLSEDEIQTRTSVLYGEALGRIARAIIGAIPVQRLIIAGGDTSGVVARELGIDALEMLAPLLPGAPLCRAHAPGSPADGMEVNFKGGQVGGEDYFEVLRRGRL